MKYSKKAGKSMKHGKRRGERIVKAKPSGYEEKKVRRLGRIRAAVGLLLVAVAAGGLWFAWQQAMRPYEEEPAPSSSSSSASQEEALPRYGDDFNLKLANADNPLTQENAPELTDFQGVQVDERIVPALEALLEAAQAAELPLEVTEGYVSPEEQDQRFEERVQQLMETEGYSRVMAEQTAVQTVARGGQDESQTGMSVRVAVQGAEGNFQDTAQYRWLSRHSIEYGFVFRYPEGKSSYTGREFDPSYIRYVGGNAASRMRALQMCLEEYAEYASES